MIDLEMLPRRVPSPSHVVTPKSGYGEGGRISAGFRPEEVESSEQELGSGESEAEFEPAGSEFELANVDDESDESED